MGAAGMQGTQKRRMSNDFWEAIMVATAAAVAGRPRFDWGKPEHQNAWKALQALYLWLDKTTAQSGPAHVAQRIKDFAAECRLCAIENRPVRNNRFMRVFGGPLAPLRKALMAGKRTPQQRDMVTQLSYIGRALPKGRQGKEGLKALQDHYDALSSRAEPLPDGRREELAAFAEEWANQHLPQFSPHLEFEPSAGACLERPRKQGGLGRYLHDAMREVIGEIPKYVKKLTTYPAAEDDAALKAHAALAEYLARQLPAEGPRAQAVVVCERGMKVRVVTKSPGALVATCHLARRWFAEGLRKDPSIRMVLAGDHEEAVEAMFGGGLRPGDTVVSSDLKSATDLISRETYEALWEGVRRSQPGQTLPKFLSRAVGLAIGPQVIEYPALGRFSHTKRGALMGLPTTWFFLCLANLAWWHLAHKQAGRKPRRVTICGDDLVGASSGQAIERYEVTAKESGAKFSSAVKHIKSQDGGVFTENVFFMKTDETGRKFGRWSQAFPIRGILGTMRSDRTGREDPYWISLGPALEQMMARREQRWRRAMILALHAAHPELEGFLREHGLSKLYHVPRIFGGLGVPRWESLWDFTSHGESFHLRAALSLSAGSGWDSDLTVLSRPYQSAAQTTLPIRRIAAEMSEAALTGRWSVRRKETASPPGYYTFPGTVGDLLGRLEGNCSRDMFFLSEPQEAADRPTKQSGRVARRLRKEIERAQGRVVTTQGGWTCGKAVTINWKTAMEKLQEIEDSRRAIYNPSLVPKRWLLGFSDQQRLEEVREEQEQQRRERRRQHLATLSSRAQKKAGGRIPLLGSQILQAVHDLEVNETSLADRPKIEEFPNREWADRQDRKSVV